MLDFHVKMKLLVDITQYRQRLFLIVILMIGESCITLTVPRLAGLFAQSVFESRYPPVLSYNTILAIWLLVLIIQAILVFFNRYLTSVTSDKILTQLRIRLYNHLQSLPLVFFHERKHGNVLALMTNDAAILSHFVTGTLVRLTPLFITFTGALFFIFRIDLETGLLVLFLVPVLILGIKLLGRSVRPLSKAMIEAYGDTLAIAEENLKNLPIIKSYTRESVESDRFSQSNQYLHLLTSRYFKIQSLLSPFINLLAASAILFLLWLISNRILSGTLDVGEVTSLIFYGIMIARPVSNLADVYGQVQRARGAVERLLAVFLKTTEPEATGKKLVITGGAVEFRDIHFSYPGRKNILTGFNMTIRAAETIAITGKNGSGKSTLAYLLLRFASPQKGTILIDGTDIQSVDIQSVRDQIGLVQQQVMLLNTTVAENISYGLPQAGNLEIEEAARASHAIEFIRKLPDGFDTVIGDQGVKLSGGQKQRLALARALIKKPRVLILDEATAMFDPEGEVQFIRDSRDLFQRCTVVLITHRPASLALADRIINMDNIQPGFHR